MEQSVIPKICPIKMEYHDGCRFLFVGFNLSTKNIKCVG